MCGLLSMPLGAYMCVVVAYMWLWPAVHATCFCVTDLDVMVSAAPRLTFLTCLSFPPQIIQLE